MQQATFRSEIQDRTQAETTETGRRCDKSFSHSVEEHYSQWLQQCAQKVVKWVQKKMCEERQKLMGERIYQHQETPEKKGENGLFPRQDRIGEEIQTPEPIREFRLGERDKGWEELKARMGQLERAQQAM